MRRELKWNTTKKKKKKRKEKKHKETLTEEIKY